MNPYLWIFIVLLALDALREDWDFRHFPHWQIMFSHAEYIGFIKGTKDERKSNGSTLWDCDIKRLCQQQNLTRTARVLFRVASVQLYWRQLHLQRAEKLSAERGAVPRALCPGKADRAEGRTQAEASEYAQSIRDQLKENATSQELFAGNTKDKWSSDMDSKDAILFGNELAATYLDGYNGVQ